jgi:hypothetical protein
VRIDQEKADRSAAYLAMWKALESFSPQADRWSEPTDFGDRAQRLRSAEEAISVARRHGSDPQLEGDIAAYQVEVSRLRQTGSAGPEPQLVRRLRDTGSTLADASVTAANTAEW